MANPQNLTRRGRGRPKGSNNRFTTIKDEFFKAFRQIGGIKGLKKWILEDPKHRGQFYSWLVQLLPKGIEVGKPEEERKREMTEQELIEELERLQQEVFAYEEGKLVGMKMTRKAD